MKQLFVLLLFSAFTYSSTVYAQTTQGLDGKSFAVKTWDTTNTNLRTPETLEFVDGKADAPVCHMYGFVAAPYNVYEKDGKTYFDFVSISKKEGELRFTGSIEGTDIKGSYVWIKEGRDDLQYNFEGELN